MDKKKIVLINQVTGYLFIDIANEFALKYHDVVLLTGGVYPMGQQLDPKIKIVKIKKYNKKSTFSRMFSWIIAFVQIVSFVKLKYRKHELFISSNPPLATLLPIFCKNRASLLIYDIYPDGLVAGNFLNQNNLIIRIWSSLNMSAYRRVKQIITLTNGMANLIAQYVDPSKIAVIPAWSNSNFNSIEKVMAKNQFIEKYNLQKKFLVVYSGNLGKEYELEALIHLSKQMTYNSNIKFLIVGDGWQKENLNSLILELGLSNCQLLPRQSSELFTDMMKAMNLGVVSLGKAVSKIAIPSKTYNILANSKPLICIGHKDSDLAIMIANNKIGITFQSDEIVAMSQFIDSLSKNEKNSYYGYCNRAKKTSLLYTSLNAKLIVDIVNSNQVI